MPAEHRVLVGARRRRLMSLGVITFVLTNTAIAQTDDPAQTFTNDQLQAFVAAQADVKTARQTWQARIEDATAGQRDDLNVREENALVAAVKAHALTPTTYNAIAEQAQTDPQLTRRIQAYMKPAPDKTLAPDTTTSDTSGDDDDTTGG